MHYKSHFMIGSAVVRELANKGHNVTLISPYELKHPNVNSVILTNKPKVIMNEFLLADISIITNFIVVPKISEYAINFSLSHENVVPLFKEKFDAVIVEIFMTEALYGLGIHFDCPVIGVTTFGVSFWTNFITRTPYPTSYVPNLFTSYSDNMSFSQRFFNTFIWISEEFLWHYLHYPKQVELYKKFFPQNKPELIEAIKNVALILNNNHFSTSTIKPSVPNVIDIGGICVQPAKELPKEFQEFLDSATEGAILFSMGSCIQAVDWPINKREIFVRVFSKLKQKVIWKYENETLPNKPDNVMISPWIPQRDILAHPNVKMFISHGGLLGTNEAIFEAVPILGIPIYGDQRMNMKVVNEKGLGLKLDFHTFNENDLIKALDEILNGSEISNKAKEFSTIYRDRPMTPQETAVYWVEYVIKHKGAPHLRTTAWKLNYIEFYNIDVYMTMLISFLSFLFLIKFAICKILLLKVWRLKNKVKKQ